MEEYEESLIKDFRDEFDDAFEDIQETLIEIEHQPDDTELMHALFRSAHSIKSNLRMMQMNTLSDFVHVVENILDDLREEKYAFHKQLSDVFLLSFEHVRNCFNQIFNGNDITERDLAEYKERIAQIQQSQASDSNIINQALALLDPHFIVENDQPVHSLTEMHFFKGLCSFVDERVFGKKNRHVKILELASAMNEAAGTPVDPQQLEVAVYLHDFGMALLPIELINKNGSFTEDEMTQVKTHPVMAATLLSHLDDWKEAESIVRHHHERPDGTGYPDALKRGMQTEGAKILAIADTFESMTNLRADRDFKRTILRAVSEINANKGTQFCEKWVDVFNQVVRQRYVTKTNAE